MADTKTVLPPPMMAKTGEKRMTWMEILWPRARTAAIHRLEMTMPTRESHKTGLRPFLHEVSVTRMLHKVMRLLYLLVRVGAIWKCHEETLKHQPASLNISPSGQTYQ
jgi:hypothetical protein